MTTVKMPSKPNCLSSIALAAALLVTAGCNSNPPAPAASTPSPAASNTQSQSPVTVNHDANDANEPHSWTNDQILTCTVSQCWHLANKSEDTFFDIVQDLAAISAKNRDITLPDDADAGRKMGEIIKSKAKSDHDALLYAIVDDAIRKVGKPAPANK